MFFIVLTVWAVCVLYIYIFIQFFAVLRCIHHLIVNIITFFILYIGDVRVDFYFFFILLYINQLFSTLETTSTPALYFGRLLKYFCFTWLFPHNAIYISTRQQLRVVHFFLSTSFQLLGRFGWINQNITHK